MAKKRSNLLPVLILGGAIIIGGSYFLLGKILGARVNWVRGDLVQEAGGNKWTVGSISIISGTQLICVKAGWYPDYTNSAPQTFPAMLFQMSGAAIVGHVDLPEDDLCVVTPSS